MIFTYPAVFHEENNGYWVDFPDLQGCQTFGDTINETIKLAEECLSGYILTLLEDEQTPAEASNIKNLKVDKNSFSTLVTCDISQYLNNTKAVKKTLTIPSWLNKMATNKGINFSGILQDALIKELKIN